MKPGPHYAKHIAQALKGLTAVLLGGAALFTALFAFVACL